MSLQYTFISEGKRWENAFPWQVNTSMNGRKRAFYSN